MEDKIKEFEKRLEILEKSSNINLIQYPQNRKIDNLGRISIPIAIRRQLNITDKTEFQLSYNNNFITLTIV